MGSRRWTSGWPACRGSPQMTALLPSAQPSLMSRHVCTRIILVVHYCCSLGCRLCTEMSCAMIDLQFPNNQLEKMPKDPFVSLMLITAMKIA